MMNCAYHVESRIRHKYRNHVKAATLQQLSKDKMPKEQHR